MDVKYPLFLSFAPLLTQQNHNVAFDPMQAEEIWSNLSRKERKSFVKHFGGMSVNEKTVSSSKKKKRRRGNTRVTHRTVVPSMQTRMRLKKKLMAQTGSGNPFNVVVNRQMNMSVSCSATTTTTTSTTTTTTVGSNGGKRTTTTTTTVKHAHNDPEAVMGMCFPFSVHVFPLSCFFLKRRRINAPILYERSRLR